MIYRYLSDSRVAPHPRARGQRNKRSWRHDVRTLRPSPRDGLQRQAAMRGRASWVAITVVMSNHNHATGAACREKSGKTVREAAFAEETTAKLFRRHCRAVRAAPPRSTLSSARARAARRSDCVARLALRRAAPARDAAKSGHAIHQATRMMQRAWRHCASCSEVSSVRLASNAVCSSSRTSTHSVSAAADRRGSMRTACL